MKNFPNGFESWHETHYEIVSIIERLRNEYDSISNVIKRVEETEGTGGFYELAESLTNEFESIHKETQWDGNFFNEIESFMEQKLFN